ncbi:hypothetical protein NM208_g6376 [Fusarium decemcellulare]|uniref:Uncharacterized protein n=1 Tax=Fusarium decemcellulare TaxID=57161 RepID=A0ACC1SDD4_9HYPO|nr:hypothetical protein NM208_g6376 [Fusarium decemcellulare]
MAESHQPQSRCARLTRPPPPMKDMNNDNITENVKIINNQCENARVRYIFERLVTHLHDFVRETRLSSQEWMAGIDFLTAAGQISDDLRQEIILISDTLGVSLLVDAVNHPRAKGATEGTVLGPFHTHDAPVADSGYVLHSDETAPKLLVLASVKDKAGNPITNVTCDVWEGDGFGFYDVQNPNRDHPDGRAVLHSDEEGLFHFVAVVPVPYPIPMDGPAGIMLTLLNRHPNRPGHIHFMLRKKGYDPLVTALYPRGDPYETSDPVFGVKDTLIVDLGEVDASLAQRYDVQAGTKLLKYDFVLVEDSEALQLREEESRAALQKLGLHHLKMENGLPVPDVD